MKITKKFRKNIPIAWAALDTFPPFLSPLHKVWETQYACTNTSLLHVPTDYLQFYLSRTTCHCLYLQNFAQSWALMRSLLFCLKIPITGVTAKWWPDLMTVFPLALSLMEWSLRNALLSRPHCFFIANVRERFHWFLRLSQEKLILPDDA